MSQSVSQFRRGSPALTTPPSQRTAPHPKIRLSKCGKDSTFRIRPVPVRGLLDNSTDALSRCVVCMEYARWIQARSGLKVTRTLCRGACGPGYLCGPRSRGVASRCRPAGPGLGACARCGNLDRLSKAVSLCPAAVTTPCPALCAGEAAPRRLTGHGARRHGMARTTTNT